MFEKTILVTGAAGFIGSSFVRLISQQAQSDKIKIVILDALTYAGHFENVEPLIDQKRVFFEKVNLCEAKSVEKLFKEYRFTSVVHFAAESHVDNSITGPNAFIQTNIIGTFNLLQSALFYWNELCDFETKQNFRFVHVSTDEVFGSLGDTGKFSETTAYAPNSPYSASKAASDHLVRAWFHTYGLPTIITNCSNNYGPRQFPEKLIPRMIQNALSGKQLTVYGTGANVRDWIHVEDHVAGVWQAHNFGRPGSSYCFGGNSERNNLQVVKLICTILDDLAPRHNGEKHEENIKFVEDRLGHDFRYAIDDTLAKNELNFTRKFENFEAGLVQTIKWYLENQAWVNQVSSKK